MKSINVSGNLKIFFIIAAAIILLGAAAWIFLGGFGTDFTGGNTISIISSEEISDEQFDKLSNDISDALESAGIKKYEIRSVYFDYPMHKEVIGIEFTFASKINNKKTNGAADAALGALLINGGSSLSENQKSILNGYLNSGFDYSGFAGVESLVSNTLADDEIESSFYSFGPSTDGWRLIGWSALGAGVGLVAGAIYCAFSFHKTGNGRNFANGVRSSLTVLANTLMSILLSVLLAVLMAVIFGTPIQGNFGAALLIPVFYSIILALYQLNIIGKHFKNESSNIINDSVADAWLPVSVISGVLIVALAVIALIGTAFTASFMITAIAGILATAFCSLFLLPFGWSVMKLGEGSKPEEESEEI